MAFLPEGRRRWALQRRNWIRVQSGVPVAETGRERRLLPAWCTTIYHIRGAEYQVILFQTQGFLLHLAGNRGNWLEGHYQWRGYGILPGCAACTDAFSTSVGAFPNCLWKHFEKYDGSLNPTV